LGSGEKASCEKDRGSLDRAATTFPNKGTFSRKDIDVFQITQDVRYCSCY
jgi:hypothetical protein